MKWGSVRHDDGTRIPLLSWLTDRPHDPGDAADLASWGNRLCGFICRPQNEHRAKKKKNQRILNIQAARPCLIVNRRSCNCLIRRQFRYGKQQYSAPLPATMTVGPHNLHEGPGRHTVRLHKSKPLISLIKSKSCDLLPKSAAAYVCSRTAPPVRLARVRAISA